MSRVSPLVMGATPGRELEPWGAAPSKSLLHPILETLSFYEGARFPSVACEAGASAHRFLFCCQEPNSITVYASVTLPES